uniref:Uncharacterized protein n=1 Tax=Fagus sylvatica TaxID=28930 RepID=A0A2N9I5C0_FAGSY
MSTANSTEQQGMEMVATVISNINCKLNTATRGGNGSDSGRISDVDCKLNRETRVENGSNSDRISDVDCKLNRATRDENVNNSDRISDVNCKLNRATRGENVNNSDRKCCRESWETAAESGVWTLSSFLGAVVMSFE